MPKIINFPERPVSKQKSESFFRRILNNCVGLVGAVIFVLFLPLFIISSIFCSAANSLAYAFTGGYLLSISYRTGLPSDPE